MHTSVGKYRNIAYNMQICFYHC